MSCFFLTAAALGLCDDISWPLFNLLFVGCGFDDFGLMLCKFFFVFLSMPGEKVDGTMQWKSVDNFVNNTRCILDKQATCLPFS